MRSLTLASVLLVSSCVVAPAMAQSICWPDQETKKKILADAGESLVLQALSFSGHLLEVWADEKDGTFTVVGNLPNGGACVLDAGEKLKLAPQGKPT